MKITVALLPCLFLLSHFSTADSQVVLSEIMFDALGSDFHDEFVEVANLADSVAVDLSGWQLTDGFGVDNIVAVDQGTELGPGQFGIVLDASYFDHSDTYDELIPAGALILTIDNSTFGSSGLSNSNAETVSLISPDGTVVSSYTYSLGNSPGFSDEKIDLTGPNSSDNWADSRTLFGTPGARNSVSPLENDLAIFAKDILFSPVQVHSGGSVTITATVRNTGLDAVSGFQVGFFEDLDGDFVPEMGEELSRPFLVNEALLPGDSVTLAIDWQNVLPGQHVILVSVDSSGDEDASNNIAHRELRVSFQERAIVINEIMYSPLSNQAEWVELYNRSSRAIHLKDWAISDSDTNTRAFVEKDVVLNSRDYFVVAEDSSLLQLFSLPATSLTILKNWPTLNNEFDRVVLFDLTGNRIDQVDYLRSWGGSSGFSLEKINPNLSSNDSTNWSTSVALAGGTPGAQNSLFAQVLPSDVTLTVTPDPFSPDNDGQDDFAVISYELPLTTAAVNVKIYDVRGRLIRFLANNQASGSRNAIVWDGMDNDNQKARTGIYIVFLQALNAESGILKTAKKTVVLAGKL
ncbi:MAG: lamin tail domain-containing protein [bacterium]